MTKQEKVAAWMEELGFELTEDGKQWCRYWQESSDVLLMYDDEANFFYDVAQEAIISGLEELNKHPYWAMSDVEERIKDLRHLKQEGKTNG